MKAKLQILFSNTNIMVICEGLITLFFVNISTNKDRIEDKAIYLNDFFIGLKSTFLSAFEFEKNIWR